MADNITLSTNIGTGASLRTDDDGSAHWQYVKLAFGADNTQNIVGDTSSNPLPVALSDTDNAVLDTIDAVLDTINAKLVSGTVIGDVNLGATDNAVLDSIDTDLTTIAGAVSGTEMQVDIVSSATITVDLGANNDVTIDGSSIVLAEDAVHSSGDAGVMALAVRNDSLGALAGTSGDYAPLQVNPTGALYVEVDSMPNVVLSATDNAALDKIADGGTSGGLSIFRSLDIDETEEEVKGTAGQVYWVHAINLDATVVYLKFYNATAASVTVGTTTPVLTLPVPTQGDANGAGFTASIPQGLEFGTAITVAATTGVADSDSTGPGANEVIVNIGYK